MPQLVSDPGAPALTCDPVLCPQGKITAQGKLKRFGNMLCCEGVSAANFRGKEHVVFLFEQNVIFSVPLGRRSAFANPGYVYKSHIQVSDFGWQGSGLRW